MRFKLGTESIRTISDGGLGVQYHAVDGWTNFQPGGIRPVLAVEVFSPNLVLTKAKRLLRNKRKWNRKEVEDKIAAQIFCEMLGMTCHKEFFENPSDTTQEVIGRPNLTYSGIRTPRAPFPCYHLLCSTASYVSQEYPPLRLQIYRKDASGGGRSTPAYKDLSPRRPGGSSCPLPSLCKIALVYGQWG